MRTKKRRPPAAAMRDAETANQARRLWVLAAALAGCWSPSVLIAFTIELRRALANQVRAVACRQDQAGPGLHAWARCADVAVVAAVWLGRRLAHLHPSE